MMQVKCSELDYYDQNQDVRFLLVWFWSISGGLKEHKKARRIEEDRVF